MGSRKGARKVRSVRPRTTNPGSSKASGDSGDGGGDGPGQAHEIVVYPRPDGSVVITEFGMMVAYFPTYREAAQSLLGFEQACRAKGPWTGPSYLDPSHPLRLMPLFARRSNERHG